MRTLWIRGAGRAGRLLAPAVLLLFFTPHRTAAHPHAGAAASAHPYNGLELKIRMFPDEVVLDTAMSVETIDRIVGKDWRAVADQARPFVDIKEEATIKQRLTAWFSDEQLVRIDGLHVKPVLKSWKVSREYNQGGAGGLGFIVPDFYAVFAYPAKSPPDYATIRWTVFPENAPLPFVEGEAKEGLAAELTVIEVDTLPRPLLGREGGGWVRLVVFSAAEPEFTWKADDAVKPAEPSAGPPVRPTVRLPIVSAAAVLAWAAALVAIRIAGRPSRRLRPALAATLLAGVAAPLSSGLFVRNVPAPWKSASSALDSESAASIFRALHANIYRAFDYTTESDIYDALAESLDGRLLEDVYKDVYESLVMQAAGGAVSRIQSVRIQDSTVEPAAGAATDPGAFAVRCEWQVVGAVYHSGHAHFRMNRYDAKYTVAPRDGAWKIVDCEVLESYRIEPDLPQR